MRGNKQELYSVPFQSPFVLHLDSYLDCLMCGKSFVHAKTLQEHENYSCQARVLFVCIPCGMTFENSRFLDQHLIRHKHGKSLLSSKNGNGWFLNFFFLIKLCIFLLVRIISY